MANSIDFKYVDVNSNPICGLTINYMVKVIGVKSDFKGSGEPRGAIYTSDTLLDGIETTNSSGIVTVDVTNVFDETEFVKLYEKFNNAVGYNVSIEITLSSDKQEINSVTYLSRIDIPRELSGFNVLFDKSSGDFYYDDINYWDNYQSYTVTEVAIDKTVLEEKQTNKLKAQRDYLEYLESFQADILSQSSLQIPYLNEYNPININQIITRCLELNVGTIENALDYTTNAGLIAETNRLTKIKTLVNQISNLYPTITIEDGEGIPYQNVGVIPKPFRGLGFYQDGGDIYAFAQIAGDTTMKSWNILSNGKSVFDNGGANNFNYNITTSFNDKGFTLNVGDVIDMVIEYEGTNYFSKLIIKN